MSLLAALGLDPEEADWDKMGLCYGTNDPELWFDKYESDENVAKLTDEICLSCPVRDICLDYGMETKRTGVWGGVYLTRGKPNKQYNQHKSPETLERMLDLD